MGRAINACTLSGYVQRTPKSGVSPNGTRWVKFTLRVSDMEPRVITYSGTGESRVITIPTFIAKRGQIYIVESSRREEWHADGWEPATM